jgi:hypothetical protein
MKDGPLGEVEYRAFLNMWLCRFIFCGKANEPTLNHIAMAEDLSTGHRVPLGKYLLGSVYHMLHQTTSQMHTGQKASISTIGISLHPAIRKERLRSPKDAKPMDKQLQPYPLIKMSANFLISSSEVSPIPFGSLI